jgi:hypothetical protein
MAAKKAKPRPSVKLGDDGKIVSLKPKPGLTSGVPEFVGKTAAANAVPLKPAKTRKKTRSGKKLTAEGTVPVPTVTRDETGQIRGTTAQEKLNARTTVLPVADRDKVQGAATTARSSGQSGVVTSQVNPVKKGFAVGYPIVKKAVDAATHHLGNMRSTHGTDEFHAHHEAFNAIHANIGQMSPELSVSLGQAKHEIMHPSDKTDGNLAMIHKAITSRLAIGRAAHEDRLKRSAEGDTK